MMNTNKDKKTVVGNAPQVKLAKPLAFPEVNSFDQLFDDSRSYDTQNHKNNFVGCVTNGKAVSSYCLAPKQSLSVLPKGETLKAIGDSMLAIDRDSIWFEIVNHDNGKSLVIANYNLIIGSRWLAYIDSATVPAQ